MTEEDYLRIVREARVDLLESDGCLDNLEEKVNYLLMYTPDLGPYIRRNKHTPFASEKLAKDILNFK